MYPLNLLHRPNLVVIRVFVHGVVIQQKLVNQGSRVNCMKVAQISQPVNTKELEVIKK